MHRNAATICIYYSRKHALLYLRVHVVDTTDTHNKGQLGFILNVEATLLLGLTLKADQVFLLHSQM